jgi:type III secretion protein C
MYQRLIADLDVPTPLIEIEAMIIDVNSSKIAELGINWSAVGRGQSTAIGFGAMSNTSNNGTLSIGASSRGSGIQPGTALISGADYLIAQLRLLEQQGDASIQARPSILTTENMGAVLDLSETSYIQTISERVALVTPVTAGTTLRVTPRLVGEGDQQVVRLTVDIEDGQIVQASGPNSMPTVRRGVISTDASVRRDESLLIGGYNSLQTVKSAEKVPLLGDIPFLRGLFSNKSDTVQRRERLFLIRSTPATSTSSMATRPIPTLRLDAPPTVPAAVK